MRAYLLEVADLPRRIEHEESSFVILTAESSLLGRVTDLNHEVDQVLNREDSVVEHRILRVDCLDEGPELGD